MDPTLSPRAVRSTLRAQARALGPLGAALYGAALTVLLAAVVASRARGISLGSLTRDPTSIFDGHPLAGALSSIGVLCWCVAATMCLFTWMVTRHRAPGRVSHAFLLSAGLLTAVLMFDDLFQFHEALGPTYLGVTQRQVLVAYVVAMLVWLVVFRRAVVATDYLFLALAAGFFFLSLAVEQTWRTSRDLRYLLEDGFKLLGIVSWAAYVGRVCYGELTGR